MAKPTASRGAKSIKSARSQVLETEAPERIEPADIAAVMKSNYQDYAAAVVVGRAIPDVRDGLKPVHRRILYTMIKEGYDWSAGYRKSARIVGSVMGLYHPHGVAAAQSQQLPRGAATAVQGCNTWRPSLNKPPMPVLHSSGLATAAQSEPCYGQRSDAAAPRDPTGRPFAETMALGESASISPRRASRALPSSPSSPV